MAYDRLQSSYDEPVSELDLTHPDNPSLWMRIETIVPPKEAACILVLQSFLGSAAEDSGMPCSGNRTFRLHSDGMTEEKLVNQDGQAVYVPLEPGAKSDLYRAITGWIPLPATSRR